jgi:hypothetical protein
MKLHVAELEKLKKRFQSRAVLAVSLETAEIMVAVMRREGDEVRAGESFVLPIGAEAAVADPERAGAALADALDRLKVRERRCVVCLPRRWAVSATTEMPEVSGEDLRGLLELRAEREFSVPVHELRLTHSEYTLPGGARLATLAGLPAKRLEALAKMLEAAGCRAVSISLGVDRSARLGAAGTSLQFLANCDFVDVVVATGGGVTTLRTLPGPADAGFDAAAFCREVRITLGRLPEAVRKGIGIARFSGPAEKVATLVRETEQPLRRLGIEHIEVEPAGAVAHPAIDAANQFLREQPVAFELVVRQASQWQTALARVDGKRRRWAVAAALGLIVLPALIFMIRSHTESSLEAEWNAMRGEVSELETLQQRIRQFRPWFEQTPQALQCLEALVSCFPESGEVWAKSTQLSETGKVTCTGFARQQSSILSLLDRLRKRPGVRDLQLQQTRGDNPVQFTIIYQWELKNAP